MAEFKPLKLIDQGGGAGALAEFGAGDTLPKGVLPALGVADISGLSTALAGKVSDGDSRLSNSREWTAETITQAEAEAGTTTTRRAWTAQRVRQAIASWWLTASTAFGRSLATATDAAAGRTALSVREQLTAARTYYVRTDGNDSNNGLSDTAGGAFLTIQKAVDVAATLDLGIFNCIIQVADGTYTGAVVLKAFVGSGQVRIIGNEAAPANVIINATGDTVSGNNVGYYRLSGVTLRGTTRNIFLEGASSFLEIGNINFDSQVTTINSHCTASRGALVFMVGPLLVSSNALVFGWALSRATLFFRNNTITFAPGLLLTQHGLRATVQGMVDILNASFVGSFTGPRYQVNALSLIWTNGAGDSFIPGSSGGVIESGGVYA